MPLMKGHSKEVVSKNIQEMVKAGYKPKQAIAASLASARKYKKMAHGGEVRRPKDPKPNPIGYPEGASMYDGGEVQSLDQGGMEDMPKPMKGKSGGAEEPGYYYADGGEVESGPDENKFGDMPVKAGGLAKNESRAEMKRKGPDDIETSLNENRYNSYSRVMEDEVENPAEMDEAQNFAKALRRVKKQSPLNVDNYFGGGLVEKLDARDESEDDDLEMEDAQAQRYAMGGLVQDGPEMDERLHGNQPMEGNKRGGGMDSTRREDASAMPGKPDGLEHRIMGDPSGPGLSEEAKKAILNKKKSRRYGSYDPRA